MFTQRRREAPFVLCWNHRQLSHQTGVKRFGFWSHLTGPKREPTTQQFFSIPAGQSDHASASQIHSAPFEPLKTCVPHQGKRPCAIICLKMQPFCPQEEHQVASLTFPLTRPPQLFQNSLRKMSLVWMFKITCGINCGL